MAKIIAFDTNDTGTIYDCTQTQDHIDDGDVLVLPDGRIGFLLEAWPVMLAGEPENFHTMKNPEKLPYMDGGKYAETAALVERIKAGEKLPTVVAWTHEIEI